MPTHFQFHLLVDGYSVIHAWDDLRKAHQRQLSMGRALLIAALTRLQDAGEYKVTVVFDGQGKKSETALDESRVQVLFSAQGQTADSIIERLVAAYKKPGDIIVVTDDFPEQDTVRSFGALAHGTEWLKDALTHADVETQGLIQKIRKKNPRKGSLPR